MQPARPAVVYLTSDEEAGTVGTELGQARKEVENGFWRKRILRDTASETDPLPPPPAPEPVVKVVEKVVERVVEKVVHVSTRRRTRASTRARTRMALLRRCVGTADG